MAEYIFGTYDYEEHWYTGERIVRCRDCKHSNTVWDMVYCEFDGLGRPRLVKPDGFCDRGKQKAE